jgi:hypothetical protein
LEDIHQIEAEERIASCFQVEIGNHESCEIEILQNLFGFIKE